MRIGKHSLEAPLFMVNWGFPLMNKEEPRAMMMANVKSQVSLKISVASIFTLPVFS